MSPVAGGGGRVLVTGASGFLGAPLVRRLCEAGAEVHAVSRIARPASPDGVRWWQADLGHFPEVERLLAAVRPGVVFHLAGHVTGAPELDAVLPAYEGLLTSTVHVLAAVARGGAGRVVLAGSLVEPEVLTDGATPGSPYAAAKWAGSVYGRMFHALYQVPVVHTRLGYTYGPGQPPTRVVAYVVRSLLRGESPRLTDGDALFDWIYVDDVVAGLMAAGSAPRAAGRAIDLGSGRLTSVREVVEHVARLAGAGVEPRLGSLPNRPAESFRAADLATAQDVLGWRPETPLTEGLQRTVEWHRAQARTSGGSECES